MIHPYSTEMQIEIDDALGCVGSCPGCILTREERSHKTPDMSKELITLTIDRLIEYTHTLTHMERLNINYGIADHGLLSMEHLLFCYHEGVRLIQAHPHLKDSSIFMSFALIGKTDALRTMLETIMAHSQKETPFIPIVVLDPALFYHRTFGDNYITNLCNAKKIFGRIDLAINLSHDAIIKMSPQNLHSFAEEHSFQEVTINWVPTMQNIQHTYKDIPLLIQWLLEFDALVEQTPNMTSSFGPVASRAIQSTKDSTFQEAVRCIIPETIRKSIQIDSKGNLLPKLEAIGDITYHPKFGFPFIGNVHEPLRPQIESAIPIIQNNILRLLNRSGCATCLYQASCSTTGFHIINHVIKQTQTFVPAGACPHVAQALFEHKSTQ